MLKIFDFTLGFVDIPAIESLNRKPSKNKERERRENSTGILSTLSQFLSLTYDDEDEADAPTSRDIEAESIGFECVRSCKVENVFKDCRFLQESSLVNLFNSCIRASYVIQNHGSSSSSNKRISISLQSSNGRSSSNSLRSPPIVPSIPENNSVDALPQQEEELNSSSLFFLEILTNIAIQNKDRMIVLIPSYVEHIEKIIALDLKANPKLVEHTATGLLRLINRAGLDVSLFLILGTSITSII